MTVTFNDSYERSVNGNERNQRKENHVKVLGASCTVLSDSALRYPSSSSQSLLSTVCRGIESVDDMNGVPTVETTGVLLEVRALWVPPSSLTSSMELPLEGPTKHVLSSYSSASTTSLVSLPTNLTSSSNVSDDRRGLDDCCCTPRMVEGERQTLEGQQGNRGTPFPTKEEKNEEVKQSAKKATQLRLSLPPNWLSGKSNGECLSQSEPKAIEERENKKSEEVQKSPSSGIEHPDASLSSSTPKTKIGHLPLRFLKKTPQGAGSSTAQTERLPSASYELYGFVRVKDSDHRLSGWYPLQRIDLKVPAVLPFHFSSSFSNDTPSSPSLRHGNNHSLSFSFPPTASPSKRDYSGGDTSCSSPTRCSSHTKTGSPMQSIRASQVIFRPILSSVYSEVTPGMSRTLRAERILDYFDERLLRDGRTPTTIRYFIYAQQFIFAPWYYAPYGLLHHSYDPTLPLAPSSSPFCSFPLSNVLESSSFPSEGSGVEDDARDQNAKGGMNMGIQSTTDNACSSSVSLLSSFHSSDTDSTECNPYIRDAYLCPFSLRIYSTFEQMQYEIQHYRAGGSVSFSSKPSSSTSMLRPPGQKIYEDFHRGIAVFEVNGSQHVTYCRHLFLIGKSFLEKKLAGHDVHNYFFFVVCLHERYFPHFQFKRSDPCISQSKMTSSIMMENSTSSPELFSKKTTKGTKEEEMSEDHDAWFFAGYFSWEKQVESCNLACIVTLPCFGMQQAHQSAAALDSSLHGKDVSSLTGSPRIPKGIGQFLIRMSYELAYRRGHFSGTPERPLSDLGELAYLHYWGTVLLEWWYHHTPSSEVGKQDPHTSFPPHIQNRISSIPNSTSQHSEYPSTKGGTERQRKNKLASGLRKGRRDPFSSILLSSSQKVEIRDDLEVSSSVSHLKRPYVRKGARACGRRRRFEWGSRASSLSERRKDITVVEDEVEARGRDGEEEESCNEYTRQNSQSHLLNPIVSSSPVKLNYSLTDIAKLVGLEVNDTRRAVSHKGLLQWSAEDRAPKWVLPKEFLKREHEKFIQRRVANPDTTSPDFYAAFLPRLLAPKGLSYQTPPHYWDDKDPHFYF